MSEQACVKNYYTDWRSVGYVADFVLPTFDDVNGIMTLTFPYPFFLLGLGSAIQDDIYPASLLQAMSGADNNGYSTTLIALSIAMMQANRDALTNPDGLTTYTGDFAGYFKNYLNDMLKPKNYNAFLAMVNFPRFAFPPNTVRSAEEITAMLFGIPTYNNDDNASKNPIPNGSFINMVNRKLLLAPGTYTFVYGVPPIGSPDRWGLTNHSNYITEGTGGTTFVTGTFYDMASAPADYASLDQAIFFIQDASSAVVYGSKTIPYGTAPDWSAFPGNPLIPLIIWLESVMVAITGDTSIGSDMNLYYNTGIPFTTPPTPPGFVIGLNNVASPPWTSIAGRPGIIYSGDYTFGTLALPVTPADPLAQYRISIDFFRSAPYAPALAALVSAAEGNMSFIAQELKPIE